MHFLEKIKFSIKKVPKNFGGSQKSSTFALVKRKQLLKSFSKGHWDMV